MKFILPCLVLLAVQQYGSAETTKVCDKAPEFSLCIVSALMSKPMVLSKTAEPTDICVMIPESLDDLDLCYKTYGAECDGSLPAEFKEQMVIIRDRHRRCKSGDGNKECDKASYVKCLTDITRKHGHPTEGLANTMASQSTCSKVPAIATEQNGCSGNYLSLCRDKDAVMWSTDVVNIKREIRAFEDRCDEIVCKINYARCLKDPLQEVLNKTKRVSNKNSLCPYAPQLGNTVYNCRSKYSSVCLGEASHDIKSSEDYITRIVDHCALKMTEKASGGSVPLRAPTGVVFVVLCILSIWML